MIFKSKNHKNKRLLITLTHCTLLVLLLGFTPFHLAAQMNNFYIIDLLVKAGANPWITADKKLPFMRTTELGVQVKLAHYMHSYQEKHAASKHLLFAGTPALDSSTQTPITKPGY